MKRHLGWLTLVLVSLVSVPLLSQQAPAGWPQNLPGFVIPSSAVNGGGIVGTTGLCFDTSSPDVGLSRSAANTLAVTNCSSTTYGTFGTGGFIAGTGSHTLTVRNDGTNAIISSPDNIHFLPTATDRWTMTAGALIATTDNVTDIGGATDNRPRTGYFSTSINSPLIQLGTLSNSVVKAQLKATSDKLTQIVDSGNVTGFELNIGTPTLGSCVSGSLGSGSHNFGGRVTGIQAATCNIAFGTPTFTNAPYCTVSPETTGTSLRLTTSATSMTISGVTSATDLQFHCVGRIGT